MGAEQLNLNIKEPIYDSLPTEELKVAWKTYRDEGYNSVRVSDCMRLHYYFTHQNEENLAKYDDAEQINKFLNEYVDELNRNRAEDSQDNNPWSR